MVLGPVKELRRSVVLHQIHRDIVQFHGIGECHQAARLHLHGIGLIVVAPVCHVLDALFGQYVGGIEGLSQSGAHPAPGRRAGELRDGVDSPPDGVPFVGFLVDHPLDVAVGQHLPSGLYALFHDLRVAEAHRRVQAHRGLDAVVVQYLLHAPEPNSQSVVEPSEVGNVRYDRHPLGSGEHRAGHRLVDVPFLHIDYRPHRHPRATGQLQRLSVKYG